MENDKDVALLGTAVPGAQERPPSTPRVFRLVYWRYGDKYRETHDSLDAAVSSAASGAELGLFAYDHIEGDAGAIVMDKKTLGAAVGAKWDEWDAEPHS